MYTTRTLYVHYIYTRCVHNTAVTSVAIPHVQGKIFDAASEGFHHACPSRHACDQEIVNSIWWGKIVPLLGLTAGLVASAWMFEVAVGVGFAVAAHTTITRLRIRMFSNLVQQEAAFYDGHICTLYVHYITRTLYVHYICRRLLFTTCRDLASSAAD